MTAPFPAGVADPIRRVAFTRLSGDELVAVDLRNGDVLWRRVGAGRPIGATTAGRAHSSFIPNSNRPCGPALPAAASGEPTMLGPPGHRLTISCRILRLPASSWTLLIQTSYTPGPERRSATSTRSVAAESSRPETARTGRRYHRPAAATFSGSRGSRSTTTPRSCLWRRTAESYAVPTRNAPSGCRCSAHRSPI
jgi:hypothetical protein